jgi:predicted DNA-binding protein (UPF0251 family)/predicted Fe-Mo cluster-binding NifX family protein
MPRPRCCRRVDGKPTASLFKPAGIPTTALDEVVLSLDGFEAIRLSDVEGLEQEAAAQRMGVSRPTFGRILEAARRNLATALIHGRVLRIAGGPVYTEHARGCRCSACVADRETHARRGCRHGTAVRSRANAHRKRGERSMNVCIPIEADQGMASLVCGHFGAAPAFLIVDTASNTCRAVVNGNQHHGHGQCAPLRTLAGEQIDAMLVGGIGMGALNKLQAAGIQVFACDRPTAQEAVAAFVAGALQPMQPGMACAGHAPGQGHGHGHP